MFYPSKEPEIAHMEFEMLDRMTISCPDSTATTNDYGCDTCCFCWKSVISGMLLLSPMAALAFMILPGTLSSLKGFQDSLLLKWKHLFANISAALSVFIIGSHTFSP